MNDSVRPLPVHLRPSSIEVVDQFALVERVSRSAVLRAAIELGLRQLHETPALLKEVLPVTTYGRGVPKPRTANESPTPEEP